MHKVTLGGGWDGKNVKCRCGLRDQDKTRWRFGQSSHQRDWKLKSAWDVAGRNKTVWRNIVGLWLKRQELSLAVSHGKGFESYQEGRRKPLRISENSNYRGLLLHVLVHLIENELTRKRSEEENCLCFLITLQPSQNIINQIRSNCLQQYPKSSPRL